VVGKEHQRLLQDLVEADRIDPPEMKSLMDNMNAALARLQADHKKVSSLFSSLALQLVVCSWLFRIFHSLPAMCSLSRSL
jgi:hypothetical protein